MKHLALYVILVFTTSLITNHVFAQWVSLDHEKNKDRNGYSEIVKSLKKANEYYNSAEIYPSFYSHIALKQYLVVSEFDPENARLNARIGQCMLLSWPKKDALKYLLKAYTSDSLILPDIHYWLGQAYYYALKFPEAQSEITSFMTSNKEKDLEEWEARKLRNMIRSIKFAEEAYNSFALGDSSVVNLGPAINSEYDDYSCCLVESQQNIFFTTRRPRVKSEQSSPRINEVFYEDIYTSNIEYGKWKDAVRLSTIINSRDHDALVYSSPDGKELVFYRGNVNNGDLFYTTLDDNGKWKEPVNYQFPINSPYHDNGFFRDSNKIYVSRDTSFTFASDIFVITSDAAGKLSSSISVGSSVNSPFDDRAMVLSNHGKELFFISNGHSSIGGYDIFKSTKGEDGQWSKPVNLGYPINSIYDESCIWISEDGDELYFSSNRDSGFGGYDLYKVRLKD
jgi:hypothetical protein